MTAPVVSVVIPAFGWPEALRLSLASALSQRDVPVEILVSGDACPLSEAVVEAAADPRVRFLNLATNSGSQAAPNNAALAVARGTYIAYLGQDDLWHPRHLVTLVAAAEAAGADVAYSVCLVFGADTPGALAVSGRALPATDGFFVPPTSLLHRADLVGRIGPWRDPRTETLPVDHELLARAQRSGATFAATGCVTAFKWPSAWTVDAYRTRDVSRQQAMAAALAVDAAAVVERELVATLGHAIAGRLRPLRLPDGLRPGDAADYNRVRRGLAPFAPLTPDVDVALDRPLIAGDGWFPPEADARGTFRWMGQRATLTVPIDARGALRLRTCVRFHLADDQRAGLRVLAGNTALPLRWMPDPQGGAWAEALMPAELACAEPGRVRLTFETTRAIVPAEAQPPSRDTRALGLAISRVVLEPAQPAPGR